MNHQDELPLAKVSEVDEAKRQWLQGMRHPVDTVTEPEPAEILAEFIRQHSAAGQLMQAPYYFQEAQIEAAIAAMDVAPEYADIRQVESSTAVLYLFSERFMTYGKAYGLCEWFEVEQFQNP
ncbi:hypothetical protein V8W72_000283 [Escherichia coli]